jgi:paraquat-inducible protein B
VAEKHVTRRARPTLVGAFVVGAVLLVGVVVVLWGTNRLRRDVISTVCDFEESVAGLSAGAPVTFLGVKLGTVRDIRLALAETPPRISVRLELEGPRVRALGNGTTPTSEIVAQAVQRGLRAHLEAQSLVTGQRSIALELRPGTEARLREPARDPRVPEIPTLPSTQQEVSKTISDLVDMLKQTDFRGITDSVKGAAGSLHETSEALKGLARDVDRGLDPLLGDLRRVTESATAVSERAQELLAPRAPLAVGLQRAIGNIERAALSLRDLADYLQRNPSSLILGKKATRSPQ